MATSQKHRLKVLRGEQHPSAKLTDLDVLLIREASRLKEHHKREARKLSEKNLAEKFDVSRNAIWKVANYASWTHLTDES